MGNYDDIIKKASKKYGIEEDIIRGVIQTESSFNPNATSSVGAGGLMQLMPATARSLGVTNVYDPEQNIMGGTKYLSQLLEANDGDMNRTLSAYNQGQGNLNRHGITNQSYIDKVYENANIVSNSGNSGSNVETKWWGDIIVIVLCILVVIAGIVFFVMSFTGGTLNPKSIAIKFASKKITGSSKTADGMEEVLDEVM